LANGTGRNADGAASSAAGDQWIDLPPGKVAAVVTSLEMFAAPPRRQEPDEPGYRLQRAGHPELAWYRDVYARVGSDWLWSSRLELADDELSRILNDPDVDVYTAQHGSEDVGLLELDFREPGTCELVFFGLLQSHVGKGAGRWLMNRALEIVWSRPISRFWVHTCTHDHPGALPFYIRSGFRPFRQQVEIFDDPRLLGTLPRSAAPHIPLFAPPGK
jgi:GNAT superfamily N-acetyltransferase